jgi:hypothetical protein
MKHSIRFLQFAIYGVLSTFLVVPSVRAEQPCLKKAWAAFNQSDHLAAMAAADECIEEFSSRAAKEQSALQSAKEKEPPTGAVDNATDKKKIFERWAINDVSTAYFVKGRSAEFLYRQQKKEKMRQVASDAYQAAAKLSFGRCWDPQGWFWSPSEASSDRLAALR